MIDLPLKITAKIWFGTGTRMRVWKKLASQMQNRMRLEEALQQQLKHAVENRSPLAAVYGHICAAVRKPRTLDEAVAGLASPEEVMLIASAQSKGRLIEGLKLVSRVLQAKDTINKSLYSSFATPVMMFFACIAMMVMISLYVMPQLAMVSNPATWTGASYVLYALTSFVGSWVGAVAGVLLLGSLIAIFVSFPLLTGRLRRAVDGHIPWSIYRLTVGTGWLYSIATRMQAGQQLAQILEEMVKDDSTPYLREVVGAVLSHSKNGEDFGRALHESGMDFPSREIVEDLRVYAKMPEFQAHLMEIADTWLAEGVVSITGYAQKIGTAISLLVWGQLSLVALVASNFQPQ